MHQPFYRHPVNGRFVLPWLRLHALKDYYGMVHLLEEFPGLRMTFNLVPSLVRQLEQVLAGGRDDFQEVGEKAAEELDPDEVAYLVRHFFSIGHDHHIAPYPRYESLYQKKMAALRETENPRWQGVFSIAELRDLQAWFSLTYFDESVKQDDPRIAGLIRKGRDFSTADLQVVREVERELLGKVIPEYRRAQERGQIEISTSPYYHPILPLLIDPGLGRVANPALPPYDLGFHWPEEAERQLDQALTDMERVFGRRPVGIWPSEGSLSEEVLSLLEERGVQWTATDEDNLARSLGRPIVRDAAFHVREPATLYRPYRLDRHPVALFFRDRHLSDLIGFFYQKYPPREAAADLHRRIQAAAASGAPVVSVILDGENAWEFFPHSGREFLREFYRLIAADPQIETATFGDCARLPAGRLERLAPGSWIGGNFDIWIGDEEDRRAWERLRDARVHADSCRQRLSAEVWAEIQELLAIAEGSDWTWWYGKQNFTPDLDIFDRLFRQNLMRIYELTGQAVPENLNRPIFGAARAVGLPIVPPQAPLDPDIDGRISDYFEWLDAGRIDVQAYGGAMNIANPIVRSVHFGFSRNHLALRLDTKKRAATYFENGFCLRITCTDGASKPTVVVDWPAEGPLPDGCRMATGDIVELSIPLGPFGRVKTLALTCEWAYRGQPFQRIPQTGSIELAIPAPRDYAACWQA